MYSLYCLVKLCVWVRTLSQVQIFLLYVFFHFILRTEWLVSSDIDFDGFASTDVLKMYF